MSILNPKNRLVSFRLSQQEYEKLHALCEAERVRSISDFVRDSVHWMISPEVARRGGGAPEAIRKPIDTATVTHWHAGPRHAPDDHAMQSISTLTSIVLQLQRKTELLDEQVGRLMFLMRNYMTPVPVVASEAGKPDMAGMETADEQTEVATSLHGLE